MIYLTRRFAFSSSHRLHSTALSGEQNACTYGLCENIHGHNYRLEVTVSGERDPKTGFFCNVLELAEIVRKLVVEPCDHHFLNDLTMFSGVVTTMENLSSRIWEVLEKPLQGRGMTLSEVLLGETDEHWVRIRQDVPAGKRSG
jgi:6-pyruvoyltetrahydropterin/6-carboxytetrahydropterin synthase